MKVLLINGSPNRLGCTYTALHEVENTLHGHDIETEILYLGKQPVAGCIACMKCAETGYCFREDQVREVQTRLDEFDAIVIGSPGVLQRGVRAVGVFPEPLVFCFGQPYGR